MRLPDGNVLIHESGQPYDPAKAHEAYLKRRHLHPRQKSDRFQVTTLNGGVESVTPQQLAKQKEFAAKRVAVLKTKLSNLSVILHDKMEKAKAAEAKSAKPETVAEKAKAIRDAKAYREKHKTTIAAKAKTAASKAPAKKAPAQKVDTVDSLKKEMKTVRGNLKNAVARQRNLAAATQNG